MRRRDQISRRELLKAMGKTGLFLGTFSLAQDLLGLTRRSWAQRAKPQKLVYSTFGGDYDQWIKESFEDPFTKKTGIALVKDLGQNPDRLSKVRLQRNDPKADIAHFMDRFLFQATSEGLLDTLNPNNLKNLKDIHPRYVQKTWIPYSAQSIGIVYNTKLVKKEIKSWYDIFDEAFRGRTFIDDIGHFGVHALIAFARLKGGNESNIDPGFKLLSEFKKLTNPRIIPTSQEGMHVFRTEQIWIGIWQKARAVALMKEGIPIRFKSPIEGDIAVSWGHGVIKGSKNKDWVEQYIDETMDPANQLKFAHFYPGFPTNKNAKLPRDLADISGYSDEELARQWYIDWAKVFPQLDEWVERWNKEIAPKG